MKKLFILTILTVLITVIFLTPVYGAHFYSGLKFQNTPSEGDTITWTNSGKQFNWTAPSELQGSLDTYGSGWNSDPTFATKNDIYDYLSLFDTNSDGSLDDQTITPFLNAIKMNALSAAPGTPVAHHLYLADGVTWDPSGLGIGKAYYVIYDGANYIVIFDEDGVMYASSIATPTLEFSELDDTSTPHTLIVSELKNKILSNSEAGEAHEYDMPARTEGWNAIFVCEAAYDMTIDPNGSENYYLNGSQLGAGISITNTACTAGESLACYSTGTAVYCESKYSDWTGGS